MLDSNNIHLDVVPFTTAVDTLGDEWTRLAMALHANPTMLPGWLDVVAKTYLTEGQLQVAACMAGENLIGLIPFFLSRQTQLGIPIRVVELATNIVSYHASVLSTAVISDLLRAFLAKAGNWHVLRVCNLVDADATADALNRLAKEDNHAGVWLEVDRSPYIPIESDWETYLNSRSKKFRYKLRQRQKMLAKDRGLCLHVYTDDANVATLYEDILSVERTSWKAIYGWDIGSKSGENAYYRFLIPYLKGIGALHAVVLYHSGTPVAYSLCCSWNGWFGQLKTSFNEDFKELSPGSIVIDESIRSAFECRASEFDFLGDMDRHKAMWTDCVRRHHDCFLYSRSARSRLLGMIKNLKNVYFPPARKPPIRPL